MIVTQLIFFARADAPLHIPSFKKRAQQMILLVIILSERNNFRQIFYNLNRWLALQRITAFKKNYWNLTFYYF
jgi:hypothetical protein